MLVYKECIINNLLLNSSFIDNIGLMHGKMGIAIFFFHEARNTNNRIYQEYAEDLIDEVYEEISTSTSLDFENGLAGIGWGIEYLVQNGFLDADTGEVLEEFDSRLFQQLIYQTPAQLGLLNGLLGIGFYLLKRLQNPNSDDGNLQTLTNKQTLIHLIDELERRLKEHEILNLITSTEKHFTPECFDAKPTTQNKKSLTFDITSDYPVLLWFLAEVWEQDVFNYKIELLADRLTAPLLKGIRPHLKSQLLLCYLALEKLKSCSKGQLVSVCKLVTQLKKELNAVTHDKMMNELIPNNVSIRQGTSGIAWIYLLLASETKDEHYLNCVEFWKSSCINLADCYTEIDIEGESIDLGILLGLTGFVFINFSKL